MRLRAGFALALGLGVHASTQALTMLVVSRLDRRLISFVALPRGVRDPVRRTEIGTHERVLGYGKAPGQVVGLSVAMQKSPLVAK